MFTINRKISQPWRPWRPSRTSSPGRFVPDAPHAPQTTDVDRAPRNIAQQKTVGYNKIEISEISVEKLGILIGNHVELIASWLVDKKNTL